MGIVFSSSTNRQRGRCLFLTNQAYFTLAMLLRDWRSSTGSRTTPKIESNSSNIFSKRRCGNASRKPRQEKKMVPPVKKKVQTHHHPASGVISLSLHLHS